MTTTTKILTGVFAAAAAGAILGILFAPDKGSETRKKIAKKGSDISDAVKKGLNNVTEAINSNYESLQQTMTEMLEPAKDKMEKVNV